MLLLNKTGCEAGMTKESYEQMMAGLKEAKEEFSRIVYPDCAMKYYAVKQAISLLEERDVKAVLLLMDRDSIAQGEDGW